jgi:hypothetical protein
VLHLCGSRLERLSEAAGHAVPGIFLRLPQHDRHALHDKFESNQRIAFRLQDRSPCRL